MALSFSKSESAYDAKTVQDWWAMSLAGNPRPLTPGSYTSTEPLTASLYMGCRFVGAAPEWSEAKGWNRYLQSQARNAPAICSIGFDTTGWDAGTPAISFTGCRGISISGVNLFRSGAGALVYDTNIDGAVNSDGLTFTRVGFGTRNDDGEAYDDPYDGLGIIDPNNTANRDGYHGVLIDATNGTDRYFFDRCTFQRLDTAYVNYSDQTTHAQFRNCYWRFCDYKALIDDSPTHEEQTTGSGNIECIGCNSYDSGPFVYQDSSTQLSSFGWHGGYLDMIGASQYQLVDAYNHGGILRVAFTGSGKSHTGSHTDGNAFIRRRNGFEERTTINGVDLASVPQGQRLFPGVTNTGFMCNPYIASKSGAPSVDDPEFDLPGMWGPYHDTSADEVGFAFHVGGEIRTSVATAPS